MMLCKVQWQRSATVASLDALGNQAYGGDSQNDKEDTSNNKHVLRIYH